MSQDRATAWAISLAAEAMGRQLHLTRTRRGLSLADLTHAIGTSEAVLCRIELARRAARLDVLIAQAVYLGVRLSENLRVAEDRAFPTTVWTDTPHRYLGLHVIENPEDSVRLARAGRPAGHASMNGRGGAAAVDDVELAVHCVGLLLWRARRRRGMSLDDLSRTCAVGPTVLCRVELARKELRLPRLIAICRGLGVRLSDILRLVEDHLFPHTVWTATPPRLPELPQLPPTPGKEPADITVPAWAVPLYTSHQTTHPTNRGTGTPPRLHTARCTAHTPDTPTEISAELRTGRPVDISRCVTCGHIMPTFDPPTTVGPLPTHEPALDPALVLDLIK